MKLKDLILHITFTLFICCSVTGQKEESQYHKKQFAVGIETPLFYKDYYGYSENYIIFCNFEYLKKRDENKYLSILAGIGADLYRTNSSFYDVAVNAEINWLKGNGIHFFEYGLGAGYASFTYLAKARVGYRLFLRDTWIFRLGYTPYVWLVPHVDSEKYPFLMGFHAVSVSLGYRFNIGKKN
ncbi:MAG: hypothetical protein KDC09_15695 [Bacteroidales bacterium]|nr:hypothetical protein [Bacteroidales bacterium]